MDQNLFPSASPRLTSQRSVAQGESASSSRIVHPSANPFSPFGLFESEPFYSFGLPPNAAHTPHDQASSANFLELIPGIQHATLSGTSLLNLASAEYESHPATENTSHNTFVDAEQDAGFFADFWDSCQWELGDTFSTHQDPVSFDPALNALETNARDVCAYGNMALAANPLPEQRTGHCGLPRRRSRYFIRGNQERANGVIPATSVQPSYALMRWQQSPPEDEPAPISTVKAAVQSSLLSAHSRQALEIASDERLPSESDAIDPFISYRRPRSRATSTTSGESQTSASSRHSYDSSVSNSAIKKRPQSRSKKSRSGNGKGKSSTSRTQRPFCCTFCCDTFKTKYDWMRHEKSLHLNLENWVCAPFGGTVVLQSTGRTHCAYCSMLDPTLEHLMEHKHGACDGQQRKFRRKDHLVQHLRFVHCLTTVPLLTDWKIETNDFDSRCGFCDRRFGTWSERCDHLALHFRNGATMAEWKGDHGFPASIASQVTRAVPPYLIDLESRTLVPFSATNRQVEDHFSQMLSRAMLGDTAVIAVIVQDFELQLARTHAEAGIRCTPESAVPQPARKTH
ncbi:hypothetical protein BJY00DRAFT_303079 [Aspergillus carlsbadensis]|nr:hypothetical protein BJY00DRAFT_303079 [Aspergillus carlsbadensis]